MELKEIAKAYIRYLKEKPLTPVIEERLRYWKDILVKFS